MWIPIPITCFLKNSSVSSSSRIPLREPRNLNKHSLCNLDGNKIKSAGGVPPYRVTLTPESVEENRQPGRLVGKFISVDKNTLDTHSYQFLPGKGADDNLGFTLPGDLLFSSELFDFEARSRTTIRVRSR